LWLETDIDVDLIDVGDPTFEWFLDRLGDKVMEDRFKRLYSKTLYDKEERLDWFEEQYAVFLHVPILVKEVMINGEKRYELRDGYHRLAVLVKRKGKKRVKAQIWQPWMTDEDWWNRTRKLILDSVYIPQAKYLLGEKPFNLCLEGSPHYNGPVYSFMISTGVKVPYIMKNWKSLGRVEARGDRFKGHWIPRIELILGEGNHELMMERWGTQPLNTYLVGHFCCGPHIHGNALALKIGSFAQIQQYYRSGYWGHDPPNHPQAVPTLREQLTQDLIGVPLLYDLGILTDETKIYFADQSRNAPLPAEEAKIFKGRDGLREYFKWIPTYVKKRKRDFNKPIEEVLSCLPMRIPA